MDRLSYIASRLLQMIPVILALVIFIFMIVRLVPGDPVLNMLGIMATPEKVEALRHHLGLDQPIWVQFWVFVENAARGDFGDSIVYRQPVIELIKQKLPLTLSLVAYSLVLTAIFTIPISVAAAVKSGTVFDHIVRAACVILMSTPEFWIGIVLLILFGVTIRIFPVGGAGTTFLERLHHLFLPAFTLALVISAVLIRNLRDATINILRSEHVVFAQVKGLSQRLVLLNHVLRNSMVVIVTLFGMYLGWLVGGSVIIESVFGVPGMGQGMVTAILGRDYTAVQAYALVYAILVSVVYLATDIAYTFVDPRVTLGDE